jgi:polyhydroxyalkanoate synthesis regulator phasin
VDEIVDASNRRSAHTREHEDFRQLVEDRQDWRIEDRLRAVLDDARARGVDVLDRDLRVLRNHVAKLEARVYGPADRLTAE